MHFLEEVFVTEAGVLVRNAVLFPHQTPGKHEINTGDKG